MKRALLFLVMLLLARTGVSVARPVEETGRLPRPAFGIPALGSDLAIPPGPGVLNAAQAGTTYFGGTFWAADSMRWEAIQDSTWTFDSGVGSDFGNLSPDVNPFKNPSLHTHMEGWVGIDNTYGGANPYFRRLSTGDAGWGTQICVGTANPILGLGGSWSFWCGALESESGAACFAAGQGYGNDWALGIEKTFAYAGGPATLSYDFANDTEPGWDFSYVYVDTSGNGDLVEVANYTGQIGGAASFNLTGGVELPVAAGPVKVLFRFVADGAYSDEDGLYPTQCGALAVDNIEFAGTGVSDFESGDDGWALSAPEPGPGGDWSDLRHLADLPPMVSSCACMLADSVLVFVDSMGGHNPYTDVVAASPWIDLREAGLAGAPFKFIQTHVYAELPLLNYIFARFNMQWYPMVCPQNGKLVTSGFVNTEFVYYFGGLPYCTTDPASPRRISGFPIDPGAEQVRIAVGVLSYCRYYGNCTGISNATPWFDNVRLGVYGSPDAPYLATREIDLPFDAFPQNGTLRIDAPGRVDCNTVKGESSPEPGSSLGDTLVVQGGSGGAEVRVQFAVRPGPYIDTGSGAAAFQTWLTQHQPEGVWRGLPWYSARMDTAEQGGAQGTTLSFMTAYHEDDPNFQGTDRDVSGDYDPNGEWRLRNDIFPDDLFTPGTRLELFYKARYDGSGEPFTGAWYLLPDTTGGNVYEMEVLPSSMDALETWNCLLYVDHADSRGAQPLIEAGLRSVVPGSSANAEGVPWDRFDVRAPALQQGSFGRPLNTQYGATVTQVFAYKAIVWDSADLPSYNLVDEDAHVLIPWLSLSDPGLQNNRLYLSGDNLAQSMTWEAASEPSALQLLEQYVGAELTCSTVRDPACPGSPAVEDLVACMPLDISGDPLDHFAGNSGSGMVTLAGNGCPTLRSFDLLQVATSAYGSPVGNEIYASPAKGPLEFLSVANDRTDLGDNVAYRAVIDGASLAWRRDGSCGDPLTAVSDRLGRVLGWFGSESIGQNCADPTAGPGWDFCTDWSDVPELVILTPDGSYEQVVRIACSSGPVEHSLVQVRFSVPADTLIRWAEGQDHPIVSGFTDQDGYFRFAIAGGLCLGDVQDPIKVQIFADGIEFGRPFAISPDAVNDLGQLPTDPDFVECGGLRVTQADLDFHQANLGTNAACSDFDGDGIVTQSDLDFVQSYYRVEGVPEEVWPNCTALGAENPVLTTRILHAAPNPFSASTRIAFELAREQAVTIRVYDVSGRLVRVLADGKFPEGRHAATWDGLNEAGQEARPGLYFYRIETEDLTTSRKLIRLR